MWGKEGKEAFFTINNTRMASGKINCLFRVAEFRSLKTAQMELSIRLWVTWSRKPKDVAGGTCTGENGLTQRVGKLCLRAGATEA